MTTAVFLTGYRLSRRLWIALAGTIAFLWLEWIQIQIIRPQLAGTLLFVLLLCRLQFPFKLSMIWWIPPMMLIWANLHGSFIMGVGLVGAWVLAQLIDSVRETRSIVAWTRQPEILFSSILLLLMFAIPLINPYGFELYRTVFTFSGDPNLYDLVEWKPLTLKLRQGKTVLVIGLILIVLWRSRKSPISTFHGLLLLVLGIAMCLTSRMIVWWGPVAALELVRQLQGLTKPTSTADANAAETSSIESRLYQGVSALILVVSLSWVLANLKTERITEVISSDHVDHSFDRTVSHRTPLQIARYLNERGHNQAQPFRMMHPMEWGDFLIWSLEGRQPVFVYSHVHLTPRSVWNDYRLTMQLRSGWMQLLDRYEINLIAMDKSRRRYIIDRLRKSDEWRLMYEDRQGVVFERITPDVD